MLEANPEATIARLTEERDRNWQEYLAERSSRMAENSRNYALEEALRPFGVWAEKMPDVVPELPSDIAKILYFAAANGYLTGAHFRRAKDLVTPENA